MRLWRITAFVAILSGVAVPAEAQPSYDCSGNLNPTEQTVCNNTGLSALDRRMAAAYLTIFDRLSGVRKSAFRGEQTQWRQDRDACGAAIGCIRANYVYRINQFDKMTGGGASRNTPAPVRLSSAKVLPDGTIERRMPDGARIRRLPNGDTERYAPDGTKLPRVMYRSNVQPATLPPLPAPLESWGTTLEGSLLGILSNILTDTEYSAYLSTESGKYDYELIDWRLRSIAFLTQL